MEDIQKNVNTSELENSTLAGAINKIYVTDVLNEITNITTKESALTVRLSSKNFVAKDNLVIDADTGDLIVTCRNPAEAIFFANHDPNSNTSKLRSDLDMIKKFQNAFSAEDLNTADQYFEGIFYAVRTHLGSKIAQQFRESFEQILREQTSAYLYLLFKKKLVDDEDDYDEEDRDLSSNEFLNQIKSREDYPDTLNGLSQVLRQASMDTVGESVHDSIGKAVMSYIRIAEDQNLMSREEISFLTGQVKVFSSTCLMPRSISAV